MMRDAAGDASFLAAVLDHIAQDQALMAAFAEYAEMPSPRNRCGAARRSAAATGSETPALTSLPPR